MPQSFDAGFMGSTHQTNFDFEAFKAKIQSGFFQQVRDEIAASVGGSSDDNNSREPSFKTSSGGRKKRSNSDPMIGDSFFDVFNEKGNASEMQRGRQKEVQDRTKGSYKRSKSVDGVDQMANMAASLFPGFGDDSDDSEASEFDFKQEIEPIEVSFPKKSKRRSSEPLINADFFDDTNINFDFQALNQKAQDMSAFSINYENELKQTFQEDKKPSSRQRSKSEPMFSDDFANAFGEGGKVLPANVDLFDSIQDLLGLDGSGRSFESDDGEKKPSSSNNFPSNNFPSNNFPSNNFPSCPNNFKRNNSAPMLSSDLFDTVFDNTVGTSQGQSKQQEDVSQDELDLFVRSMFSSEKGNQAQGQVFSGGPSDHQRSRSLDALASFPMMGNNAFNMSNANPPFPLSSLTKDNPSKAESLLLYDLLLNGGGTTTQSNTSALPYNCLSLPQATCTNNQMGQFNTSSTPATSNGNEEATLFILKAVKSTQNQLQTLHPLVMKSGNTPALEEVASAFRTAAAASQFVLSGDLPTAVAELSKAQTTIEILWSMISSGNLSGNKSEEVAGNIQSNMVSGNGMVHSDSGAQSRNMNCVQRDSDSVCSGRSSLTGISVPSRSPSPPMMPKVPDFDCRSVMSNKSSRSNKSIIDLKDLPPQDSSNPDTIMVRLKALMERTQQSQKDLQKWDKKNGLPKSHSQTMVNSSRSRKQLQEGVVLKKWNGVPLIGNDKK
jgi:hypothetical protein